MLIGRTLRGTLGESFRREALAWFGSRYGTDDGARGTSDGGAAGDTDDGALGKSGSGAAGDTDDGALSTSDGGAPGDADDGAPGTLDGGAAGKTDDGALGTSDGGAAGDAAVRSASAGSLRSSLSRTVELTAVAVTRAGAVSVDVGIADPAFRSPSPRSAPVAAGAGERVFEVRVDDVEGIGPIAGPPGADLTRWAVVRVRPDDPGTPLAFHLTVLRAE